MPGWWESGWTTISIPYDSTDVRHLQVAERGDQNSALPGVRGKGITSRMLAIPVMN